MTQLQEQVEQYLNQGKLENVIEVCEQALEQDSQEITAYHGLGVALQLKGQLEEAKVWYTKALEQQPNLAEIYVNLGSLYAQQQQWQAAIQAYETAIELKPDLAQAYRSLAKILYQQEQPEKATEYAYKALQLAPDLGTAQQHFQIGNQLWELKKLEEAVICYQQAVKKQPDFLAAYFNLAETQFRLQIWEQAEQNYHQVLKLNPKFERAYIGLGNILAAKEQWDEAIALYEKAIDSNPQYPWAYNRLGNALTQKKSWKQAVEAYQKSIELNPTVVLSYEKLGDLFFYQEKWQKSVQAYQKAVDLDPNCFWAYQGLGRALYQQGKSLSKRRKCQESIAAYSKAIQLDPQSAPAYYNLGLSLWQMKQWEDGVAAYIQAIKLQPQSSIFLHHLESILRNHSTLSLDLILQSQFLKIENEKKIEIQNLIELSDKLATTYYTKAAAFLCRLVLQLDPQHPAANQKITQIQTIEQEMSQEIQQAQATIQEHPQSFEGYRDLGALLLQKNYWHESTEAYLEALKLQPQLATWYYEREFWNLIQHQNKLDRVVEIYHEVVKTKPRWVNCHVNLGKALSLQGKLEDAINCYREAGRQKTLARYAKTQAKSDLKLVSIKSPDFIIIGAQKCGTTSLYHYLAQHPRIVSSIVKEIDFWSRDFNRGLKWYMAQFPPRPKGQKVLTGEASPSYLNHPYAPERLYKKFPQVKLIVLLRNPVNRTISHYYHWLREDWTSKTLQEAIETDIQKLQKNEKNYWSQSEGYVARGAYIKFLKKWMSIFPREQFLIIKSEDFYENPAKTLSQVYDFIDIDDKQLDDYQPYNSGSYSSIDPDVIKLLQDYFKPFNAELEDFLEMKFNWD